MISRAAEKFRARSYHEPGSKIRNQPSLDAQKVFQTGTVASSTHDENHVVFQDFHWPEFPKTPPRDSGRCDGMSIFLPHVWEALPDRGLDDIGAYAPMNSGCCHLKATLKKLSLLVST